MLRPHMLHKLLVADGRHFEVWTSIHHHHHLSRDQDSREWSPISKYNEDVGVLAKSLHLVIDQWIQYKLGKQYL